MPTLLRWEYTGREDDSPAAAERGEQRAFAGDAVNDDVHGEGVLDRLEGAVIFIRFPDGEVKQRTCAYVRAKVNRPVREMPARIGRCGTGMNTCIPTRGVLFLCCHVQYMVYFKPIEPKMSSGGGHAAEI